MQKKSLWGKNLKLITSQIEITKALTMYVRIFFADIVLMLIVNKKNESFISLIPFMEQRGGPERNQTKSWNFWNP